MLRCPHPFARHLLCGLLLVALLPALALAQAPGAEVSDALREDAASYAAAEGVDFDEAVRRLQLQLSGEIGALERQLAEGEPDTFAGLWIQHQPTFGVVVRSTDPRVAERVAVLVAGTPLASLTEVKPARYALAQLGEARAAAHHLAAELGVEVESDINVYDNLVELYAVEVERFAGGLAETGLRLPDGVTLVAVDGFSVPEQTTLLGGRGLSTCTGAFTVRHNYSGELGLLTAAHCGNTQRFAGITLPFRFEDQSGNQDVQWHAAACGMNVADDFESGIGLRDVSGTQHRDDQAIGSYVCKNGMTTGYTCGYIQSRSYCPTYVNSCSSTFIRVDGRTVNLSEGGDSGGPWFVETLAYGVHSGQPGSDGNDALYMPINYISSLNVSVLTAPPTSTTAPLDVTLNCWGNYNGSYQVTCQAIASGGSPPYSYSWSYSGTASSWSSSGSYAYAYYYGSGCQSGNVNFFSVTVTDSCSNSDFGSIGPLSCY